MNPDTYDPKQEAPLLDEITYNWPEAAKKWVAGEVAAGRLEDITRTEGEVHALFTTENVLKHMEMANLDNVRAIGLPGL